MFGWRITKYDPAYRDEDGAYLREDWTSCSDVGRIFDRRELTYEDYKRVEDAYVETALHFFAETGLAHLKAVDVHDLSHLEVSPACAKEVLDCDFSLEEDELLAGEKLELVYRLCLRDLYACQLVWDDKFYVHFGFDYYMYIGSVFPSRSSIRFAQQKGLYVEEMMSPYLPEDEEE